jgi:hypothetical protein
VPEKERPIRVQVYIKECPDFINGEMAAKVDNIFD